MSSKESPPSENINLQLSESVAKGQYANVAITAFNQDEFIVDFGFIQPHVNQAAVLSRIIMNPKQIKRLSQLLDQNILDYEKQFGPISDEPNRNGIKLSAN